MSILYLKSETITTTAIRVIITFDVKTGLKSKSSKMTIICFGEKKQPHKSDENESH